MSDLLEKRAYKEISATTTDVDTETWTIADGTEIVIHEMGVNSSHDSRVFAAVVWDTEILLVSHGDVIRKCEISITGDGVKKLFIKMDNQSDSAETIGGYYRYEENT